MNLEQQNREEEIFLRALELAPGEERAAWLEEACGGDSDRRLSVEELLEEHDEARRLIDRALQMIPDDPYVHYYNGLMLNRTGDASRAIEALRIAVRLGYPAAMLAGDPNLSNLRGDLRFRDIAESPREERQ